MPQSVWHHVSERDLDQLQDSELLTYLIDYETGELNLEAFLEDDTPAQE
jgi:hypothetical protein